MLLKFDMLYMVFQKMRFLRLSWNYLKTTVLILSLAFSDLGEFLGNFIATTRPYLFHFDLGFAVPYFVFCVCSANKIKHAFWRI